VEVVGDTIGRRCNDGAADVGADVNVAFDRERGNGPICPRTAMDCQRRIRQCLRPRTALLSPELVQHAQGRDGIA
jgi:hypothetical protein